MPGQAEALKIYSAKDFRQTPETPIPEFQRIFERLSAAKALVFFDLDKTAIGTDYKATNPEGLRSVISKLQKNGVLVGIHSDSPRETVMQFAEMFGAEGPCVYEMAGVHFPEKASTSKDTGIDIALNIGSIDLFASLRNRFYEAARQSFPDNGDKYLITQEQDHNQDLREGKTYPGFTKGLWINPLRRFSFGLWATSIGNDGKPLMNAAFHTQADTLLRETVSGIPNVLPFSDFDWDYNPEYGDDIIKLRSQSSKTPPLQTIIDAVAGGYDKPVYMIGDSASDFIDDPRVTTLAVANAKQALKDKLSAEQISDKNLTDGVIDLMEKIAVNLGIEV